MKVEYDDVWTGSETRRPFPIVLLRRGSMDNMLQTDHITGQTRLRRRTSDGTESRDFELQNVART